MEQARRGNLMPPIYTSIRPGGWLSCRLLEIQLPESRWQGICDGWMQQLCGFRRSRCNHAALRKRRTGGLWELSKCPQDMSFPRSPVLPSAPYMIACDEDRAETLPRQPP